ncbi:MAG: SPFH domain-containing protein [Saprospiraceae bacterium]|nr:SPFH domain-containing protein [Candidatus Vicinibacter affinis]MBK7799807.1 SPFH domain-containing protein [Candidatus Vicinibacter affinis]MBK8404068.1 SPFH domain-containing protein [Candidatus Vicinibacter affinis]MBK8641647.1 SPFH domain-containing protein [Candidatus Vicinibacter affinis]MBK9640270.1 SPFH domain-containing protein [Candidatus Vicinibacter affinis]
MGIFDFLKNEFVESIDWVDVDGEIVLYKFPDKQADIKYGAALTVRPSQVAIFVNEGQIADVFQEGLYTLETQNMPLLTKLKNWQMGFNSPFKCDVYFVSLKSFTQFKWGTPNPIIMRDSQFGQVRVKAFGTYMLRIKEPVLFFKEFAGNKPLVRQQEIEATMRDFISPKFAEALAESKVSVMDMVSNYSEIGNKVLPLLQDDFDQFGITLTKYVVTSISLPEEVEAFYDKITNMNMAQDLNRLTQFEASQAIQKAAENQGTTGAFIGMNMGANLGNAINNQMQSAQSVSTGLSEKEKIMDTIRELGKLKLEGLLSDAEFEEKKKELLARL